MFRVVYIGIYRMHDVEDESACGRQFQGEFITKLSGNISPFFLLFLRPTLDRRFDDVRREIDFVSELL